MLFKFTWVAITALALWLPSCGDDDEDGDKNKKELTLDGGAATFADNKVTVSGTVKQGGDAADGISVVFKVKCGENDEVAFAAVESGDDGKVTSAALAVAGASDQGTLDKCGITAVVGEGDDAETVTVRADTTPAAAAEMLMGEVHELTWTAENPAVTCAGAIILKVDGDTLTVENFNNEASTAVGILVLPTAADADDCSIGDQHTIKAKAAAYDNTTVFGSLSSCNATTCWKWDGTNAAAHSGTDPAAGEDWIKKDGTSYIFHDLPS